MAFKKFGIDSLEFKNEKNYFDLILKSTKIKFKESLSSDFVNNPERFHSRLQKLMGFGNRDKKKTIIFPGSSLGDSNDMIVDYFSKLVNTHEHLNTSLLKNIKDQNMPIVDEITVYHYLNKLKQSSTPAPRDVPTFIYKEFALLLSDPLSALINLSLVSRKCPGRWKMSFLIPLPKISKPQSPDQIRPIVISSPLSKVIERIIMFNLGNIIVPKLDKRQFGGIKGKNTVQYLSIYLHTVLEHLEKKDSSVISILTDFKKAFDNVNHNILMEKLLEMSDHSILIEWIASFLEGRSLFLFNDRPSLSKSFGCSNGLPQGSVMGCMLYAVYVNELAISSEQRLKFVDDLTIPCLVDKNSIDDPQLQLDKIFEESKELLIPFNVGKCLYIEHNFRDKSYVKGLILDDHQLSKVDSVKILGIYIQKNLTWSDQVLHMLKMVNSRIFLLFRLKQFGISIDFMLYAYITYIRPVLEYAVPIWNQSITKSQIFRLEAVQKRICRIILGPLHESYDRDLVLLNLKSLSERRKDLTRSFAVGFLDKFPEYMPMTHFQISGKKTRNSNKFALEKKNDCEI